MTLIKECSKVKLSYNPTTKIQILNNYEVNNELGVGTHSKVKLGKNLFSNQTIALKIVNKVLPNNEIKILRKINNQHNNLIKLFEILNDHHSKKIYLVLEYCPLGEIVWYPNVTTANNSIGPGQFSFQRCKEILKDITSGLSYLHCLNIIHRDIKPSNLLISDDGTIKISDFSISMILDYETVNLNDIYMTVGTPLFFSPEICLGCTEFYSKFKINVRNNDIFYMIDTWSLGVTLYCLIFGKLPFNSKHELELFNIIINDDLQFPTFNTCYNLSTMKEYELSKNLLSNLLTKNPLKRFNTEQILLHPFLTDTTSLSIQPPQLCITDIEQINGTFNNYTTNANTTNNLNIIDLPINSSFASLDSFYVENFAMSNFESDNSIFKNIAASNFASTKNLIMTPSSSKLNYADDKSILYSPNNESSLSIKNIPSFIASMLPSTGTAPSFPQPKLTLSYPSSDCDANNNYDSSDYDDDDGEELVFEITNSNRRRTRIVKNSNQTDSLEMNGNVTSEFINKGIASI
ncbi:hypothetical protein KAFR_0C03020 [Kazachstania africana CBS 2517]|uniref:Protein kinase domain-containing protein n=1 Tax=Kazachstania africana (strain ATCC 22294 / BCRC 22015 / CBS 2517 / CECT 1963 / NBRC 1671 / NRRL Y-8276) TaxID=1071382 RepID=H2ASE5_KAZAF|nr:hypothetical protein KAFR_0C03020 [Kazachstania africana CBS 2517]CCF57295.1 hypothetical protein KAFR_0C03020 [Kazachstania africana CBS 2517]